MKEFPEVSGQVEHEYSSSLSAMTVYKKVHKALDRCPPMSAVTIAIWSRSARSSESLTTLKYILPARQAWLKLDSMMPQVHRDAVIPPSTCCLHAIAIAFK